MPSLRRSFSSPSVRSSPYLSSPTTRTRQSPRRSSGSTTAERRVLADIEWWRVYDGQCDLDLLDNHQLDAQPGGTVTLSAGGSSLEPLHTPHSFSLDSMQSVFPDALSIAPYSPSSRHGRDSSVESTPELPPAPLETIHFGLADPSSFTDRFLFPSSLARVGGRQPRSISAPALSHRETFEPDFADLGAALPS
ncbi:hypothetical protein JVU11DRAFT_636 [Chiua virens]|nr:hypothetical protein JVU11DRAFT_636 [Chiua virens]